MTIKSPHISAEDLSLVNINMKRWITNNCMRKFDPLLSPWSEPNLICISNSMIFFPLWDELRDLMRMEIF